MRCCFAIYGWHPPISYHRNVLKLVKEDYLNFFQAPTSSVRFAECLQPKGKTFKFLLFYHDGKNKVNHVKHYLLLLDLLQNFEWWVPY
jgi:hypothetical protein